MSKLRTYSKNQKTVDNPNIFANVDSNKMDISFEKDQEPVKTTTSIRTKRTTKKDKEHIPEIEEEERQEQPEPIVVDEIKKTTRTKKQTAKSENEDNTSNGTTSTSAKTQSKRKNKSDNKENKSGDEQSTSNTDNNKQQKIKLFQSTDSEMTDLMPPPVDIPQVQVEHKGRGRPANKAKETKKTLRSVSSASNILTQPKRATKTAEKQTTSESTTRKKLTKSNSATNLTKPDEMSIEASGSEQASKELKSIMKQTEESTSELSNGASAGLTKPKRAVRILEKIDDKNDHIENLKIDNKAKHSASTSTPSGARRRPLKAPQDVSMISKS